MNMNELTYKKVSSYLEHLQLIYKAASIQKFKKELKELDQIIEVLKPLKDTFLMQEPSSKNLMKKNKAAFPDIAELFLRKEFPINGTKLDFSLFNSKEKAAEWFESEPKTKLLKNTTLLDLKLLYCLLTGQIIELKGKKEEAYEAIKTHTRAKRTGEAFAKMK
ncbi:hypothetical protein [Neobacillus terrae]|uniref:hypothetical protein n=1 Tax=Neobacillus terrae TaxID=3034837 RepID=UPI001407A567|nr:hypothetical protein [Neobacillus terrae]NHM32829.1 hypothetical protein [Neobacillus terrae]